MISWILGTLSGSALSAGLPDFKIPGWENTLAQFYCSEGYSWSTTCRGKCSFLNLLLNTRYNFKWPVMFMKNVIKKSTMSRYTYVSTWVKWLNMHLTLRCILCVFQMNYNLSFCHFLMRCEFTLFDSHSQMQFFLLPFTTSGLMTVCHWELKLIQILFEEFHIFITFFTLFILFYIYFFPSVNIFSHMKIQNVLLI